MLLCNKISSSVFKNFETFNRMLGNRSFNITFNQAEAEKNAIFFFF